MRYQYRGKAKDPACGTLKGYAIHVHLKTRPCADCEQAITITIAYIDHMASQRAMVARIDRARIARGRSRRLCDMAA